MRVLKGLICAALLSGATPSWSQTPEADVAAFRRLRAEAIAAANAQDVARASELLAEADRRLVNHPGLILMRARLAVAADQPDEAIAQLSRYAAAGLVLDPAADRALSTLSTHPRYGALVEALQANRRSVGGDRMTTLAEVPGVLLVESVVRDAVRGRWLVSQVRGRTIVAMDDTGAISPFLAENSTLGGVLGLVSDDRNGVLWAATAPVPPSTHGVPATTPRLTGALLKIDMATGRLLARYPAPEGDRTLGDVALGQDGTVYVADSTGGDIFRLRPDGAGLEILLPAGTLGSPQGMALSPDGAALIVADYSSGLWRIELGTGVAMRLVQPATDSLIGVDGLTRDGGVLFGFQNGVAPQRVLMLTMNAGWTGIDTVEVLAANLPQIDEPTTGIMHDGALVFVSRSQWSAFGQDGAAPETTAPAVISRLSP